MVSEMSFVQQIMSLGRNTDYSGLYDIPGYGPATVAQKAMYCWLQRMDVDNELAVMLANAIAAKTKLVKAMAAVMDQLNTDGLDANTPADVGDYDCPRAGGRCSVRDFLSRECGLTDEDLSKGLDDYVGRQVAIDRLQYRIQKEMSELEYRQADLQIALNRAETCSATCSNMIRQFAKPTQNSASQI